MLLIPNSNLLFVGWEVFKRKQQEKWLKHGVSWLESDKKLFVIQYEKLKLDLRGLIRKTCQFLELETNDTVLNCVYMNQEGLYHRPKNDQPELLVYTEEETDKIKQYNRHVQWYLKRRCPNLPACLPRSKVTFDSAPYKPLCLQTLPGDHDHCKTNVS